MNIRIEEVNEKNKEESKKFTKEEWDEFNKEKNFTWNEKKYSFILKENNEIKGYLKFVMYGGSAYLDDLIVEKGSRKNKFGEKLLKKFEEFIKEKDCHFAYLKTSEKHKEALEFYKKHNYKIAGELNNAAFHIKWYFLTKEII